jgi:hypothetical protein
MMASPQYYALSPFTISCESTFKDENVPYLWIVDEMQAEK